MKHLEAVKINAEDFRQFGNYISIMDDVFTSDEYKSDWTFELYRGDNLTMSLGKTNTIAGFSFGLLKKRPMVITSLQAHCHTEKTILLEKDCILVVAPVVVNNIVGEDKIKAFILPAAMLVKLNFYIWHATPFPIEDGNCIYAQCTAPRSYNDDTREYKLTEKLEIIK